jgi:thioredoxin 1
MPGKDTSVIEVTDDTIAKEAKKNKVFIVDCWAPRCTACITMFKMMDKLSEFYKGEVKFAKINVNENKKCAEKYGITTVPTLLLFHEGKFEDIILGTMPLDYIKNMIKEMLERTGKGDS